jgi:hypothetical protein
MRITFVLPLLDLTGGSRVVSIYAAALSRMGHQVLVVAPRPQSPTWREILRSFRRHGRWPSA